MIRPEIEKAIAEMLAPLSPRDQIDTLREIEAGFEMEHCSSTGSGYLAGAACEYGTEGCNGRKHNEAREKALKAKIGKPEYDPERTYEGDDV